MTGFVVRFRLQVAPGASAEDLDEVFRVLETRGVAEDMSPPDPTGLFTMWLSVEAGEPRGALASALDALSAAEATVSRGSPIVGGFVGAELELEDSALEEEPVTPLAL